MRLTFLTSLNNCKLFHLRDLVEFAWHGSHLTKTPSTSRVRKMQDGSTIETRFYFHLWDNTLYLKSRQENNMFQMFQENKKADNLKVIDHWYLIDHWSTDATL